MASRTGTAEQIDAHLGSGSIGVTVPADATAAIALWSHFNALGVSGMFPLDIGGNIFTIRSEIQCKTPGADQCGVGVATLTNLPGAGSQTLSWAWSDTDPRDEGGGLFIVWVKDVLISDLVRDADTANQSGSSTIGVTLDTASDDLVLGLGQSFTGTNPTTTNTAFISNVTINSEVYDIVEVTPEGDNTTLVQVNGDYPSLAAIALKNSSIPPVTDETPYRHNVTPMTWR